MLFRKFAFRIGATTALIVLLIGAGQPAANGAAQVVISEFMAINDHTLADGDGAFPDWIELHNRNNSSVDLTGWYLTDDAANLTRWQFPRVVLAPDEYLVVFASNNDRSNAGEELHTSFRLRGDGEYLALVEPDGVTVAHEYSPQYPEQRSDVSYGLCGVSDGYCSPATPGEANGDGYSGIVAGVEFSEARGFYEAPFTVTLTTATLGARIRYTVDGSAPTVSTGRIYSGPISIETTTCLRAAAFGDGQMPSWVATQTFIFPRDVLTQPSHPVDFPDTWGWDEFANPPEWTPADYEMDQEVIAAGPRDVEKALLAIPTISLVMDRDDLFSRSEDAELGGIYANPWSEGVEWERPASVELIYPDGKEGFQINCGVRIYGGMGRAPWAKKHTFRLLFKSAYGPTELDYPLLGAEATDGFNTIILRANFNDGWHMLWDHWKLERVQLVRDEWVRSTQVAMGSVGSHGIFVHLYIDGLYWGLYNPVERPDAAFSASYLGGERDDWDVLHDGDPVQGDRAAWKAALEQANAGLNTNEAYQRLQGNNSDGSENPDYEDLLDVEHLADYMLLNFYAGTEDWDIHNWYAGRRRTDGDGYKIYVWDAEITHLDLQANLIDMNAPGCPSQLFQALRENVEFRMLFADRVQRHLFGDGALTPDNAAARYRELTGTIDRAVVAESARWGDAVRVTPYTRDNEWVEERDALLHGYFPRRGTILLRQLRNGGLFPVVDAPEFLINGAGDMLSMAAVSGTIYYTLDGSDPRLPAEPDQTVLVPKGAEWQFLDDGSDQGTSWRTGEVAWPYGSAQLGYGDGDEQTVVSRGSVAQAPITTYFRNTFAARDTSERGALMLRLLRDDGAVIYLNGEEVVRSNMAPDEPVYFDTLAHDSAETESSWFEYSVDASGLLSEGENVLAVEIHQWITTSSDISFDLELVSGSPGAISPNAKAYSDAIPLNRATRIKARALAGSTWSALAETTFTAPE